MNDETASFGAIRFDQTRAFSNLEKLARNPVDLTHEAALTPERVRGYRVTRAAGIDVLYGMQRVDDEVLAALGELADETQVMAQFRQILAGDIMNRIEGHESEGRQVTHHACRDVFGKLRTPFNTAMAEPAKRQAREQLKLLEMFMEALDEGQLTGPGGVEFTDLIHVGIGGSELGPKAMTAALWPHAYKERRIHFVSNADPDNVAAVLARVDLARTLVSVVSKSGGTLETRANEIILREAFLAAGLKPEGHFVCVTEVDSPMDRGDQYLARFHMPDSVGGRFSATSMVGGVPLGFLAGAATFREFLQGAREMDLACLSTHPAHNPALMMALLAIWNRNFLGLSTLSVVPYSQGMERFAAHLQQVDMESNGKRVNRLGEEISYGTGPIIWGEVGTNSQHAYFQHLHQSAIVTASDLIGFRSNQSGSDSVVDGTTSQQKLLSSLMAQSLALAAGRESKNPSKHCPGNRPNSLVMADRLTPYALGALLALYENKVVLQGLIWNINSFDQEGVQLGKTVAGRLLPKIAGQPEGAAQISEPTEAMERALLETAGLIPPAEE